MVNARVDAGGAVVASMTASRVARDRVRRLRIFQPASRWTRDCTTFHAVARWLATGTGSSIEEIVETVPLEAPADALGLELAAFVVPRCAERAAIVSAAEGRTALSLALDVTAAVQRAPVPALDDEPADLGCSRGSSSGDLHGGRVDRLGGLIPGTSIGGLAVRGWPQRVQTFAAPSTDCRRWTAEILDKLPAHIRLLRIATSPRDATIWSS